MLSRRSENLYVQNQAIIILYNLYNYINTIQARWNNADDAAQPALYWFSKIRAKSQPDGHFEKRKESGYLRYKYAAILRFLGQG